MKDKKSLHTGSPGVDRLQDRAEEADAESRGENRTHDAEGRRKSDLEHAEDVSAHRADCGLERSSECFHDFTSQYQILKSSRLERRAYPSRENSMYSVKPSEVPIKKT